MKAVMSESRLFGPMFFATSVVIVLSIGGMFLELRAQTWLYPMAFALVGLLPHSLIRAYKRETLRSPLLCLAMIGCAGPLAFSLGTIQNERALAAMMKHRGEALVFLARHGRPPTLDELSAMAGTSNERLRHPTAGGRLVYSADASRIACFVTYQFPSAWARVCLDTSIVERRPDDL